jgi:16S rRNA (guanine527-N7)-methyltransferase
MTEEEARAWLDQHFDVPRETWIKLEGYVELLLKEATRQNLIAASTWSSVWARHIVDSAQLLLHAPNLRGAKASSALWIDLGAGAGLPGIVIAILSNCQVQMIEMRRKRVEFLDNVIRALHLDNAEAKLSRVEGVHNRRPASVITARAFAPLDRLVVSSIHLADKRTVWLLPKGSSHQNELDIASTLWHSECRVERSVTAPESAVIVLQSVQKAS